MGFVKVLDLDQLEPGQGKQVEIEGVPVGIFRVDDEIFAINDVCTHAQAYLSEGKVNDCDVACPRHGARFDLRTGKALSMPAYLPVQVYAVRVEDGAIWVSLDDEGGE